VQETYDLGETLIDAVSHIASLDLVHRDLKPENIMFREDGATPVIVDFGMVRMLSETSITESWQPRGPGTPFYAAPEQLNNDKHLIDWRTDQYALGILLAEATFGYHPFKDQGEDDHAAVDKVARRLQPSARFRTDTALCGLQVLAEMVKPWPSQRVRMPAGLAKSWRNQEVKSI